jgi:hypothetical protein
MRTMAENDDIAQNEDEAIRRGYQRTDPSILEDMQFFAHRRPCGGAVQKGDWCLMTNCRPDNTLTVCYCDGNGNCANCYVAPCGN